MNGPSKITVDYSSLVGLKAELLRKRLEAREIKAKNSIPKIPRSQKSTVKKKKSVVKEKVSPKETEIEDISTLKKSKLMLEAKSRLYDKLQKSHSNINDLFLVDFAHKSDPESDPEKSDSEDSIRDEDCDSDDNFVEYTDCFGRTRKCLREDLPKMQEKDNLLREQITKEPSVDSGDKEEVEEVPQREPEIEIMRRKWEEQTRKLADKVNIHYQDVLFDEARTHGVGYYNFSVDEEERAKQHENLAKLRKETEQKQKEMRELKEMRDKMEQNRLRIARIRKRIRAGLPPELPEEEENPPEADVKNQEANTQNSIEEEKEECNKKEDQEKENSLAIIEDKIKAFGELLGKRTHWREMSQEEWVEKRRKDRLSEFAPMYNGFESGGFLKIAASKEEVSKERCSAVSEDDSDNSEFIGPLPVSNPFPSTSASTSILVSPVNEEKDEESDDSEIIGPMPYTDLPAFIPLPPNPPPSTSSLPPVKNSSSNFEGCSNDLRNQNSINSEKIVAGLKYLREKFEQEKKSEREDS